MRRATKSLWAVALLASSSLLVPGRAGALDTFLVGPRAMGMGGANIASTADTTAQYYNPAAFGFFACRTASGGRIACDNNNIGRKTWGLDLNASGGYRLHNEFGVYLDDLVDIDYQDLSRRGVQSESDLRDLIDLVKNLDGLDDPGNAITADVNAGLGIRVKNFGVGVRGFFQATGQVVELDRENLGIQAGDLEAQIAAVTVAGNDGAVLLLTPDQQERLREAGLSQGSIQKIDFLARGQGVSPAQAEGITDLLATVTAQSGGAAPGGTLDDNTTTVVLRGFAVAELPISYGYALNDHWSVGGNLKLMRGRVYATEILVFDANSEDVLRDADKHYRETNTFGIDLGVMGRYRMVNFGVVGRNLNTPKFDGPTRTTELPGGPRTTRFPDVKIKPQFAAGIAFIPFETLTLEVDCDLTANETTLPGYKTRNLSAGLEWDAFRFLALRAGARKNLAESDIGVVYTAGLGLNLWAARLDVAGAFAAKREEFDGKDVPKETRAAAQFSVDF